MSYLKWGGDPVSSQSKKSKFPFNKKSRGKTAKRVWKVGKVYEFWEIIQRSKLKRMRKIKTKVK